MGENRRRMRWATRMADKPIIDQHFMHVGLNCKTTQNHNHEKVNFFTGHCIIYRTEP